MHIKLGQLSLTQLERTEDVPVPTCSQSLTSLTRARQRGQRRRLQGMTASDTVDDEVRVAGKMLNAKAADTCELDGDASSEDLPIGAAVAEYLIEKVIGRGGMGTVYRAKHPVIGGRVAIKVISGQRLGDKLAVTRFIREARTANEIGHRNIVDVFTCGYLPDGRVYYVMEYLEGISLSQRLRAGRLSVEETLRLLEPIARALDAAHAKGVIHRDIKPANIFLVREAGSDETTFVKLLDFGIAKLLPNGGVSEVNTQSNVVVGTPSYMAPEQWGGGKKTIGPAADVYALGAVAYRCLTGALPFKADNIGELLFKQQTELPVPPSFRAPELPTSVDAIVVRALSIDPQRRHETASALIADLAMATSLRALPPTAKAVRADTPSRVRPWHILGALFAGSVLVAAIVSVWPDRHSMPPRAKAQPTLTASQHGSGSGVVQMTPSPVAVRALPPQPTVAVVRIAVSGMPNGAAIEDPSGKRFGRVGDAIEIPRGASPQRFVLSATGYVSQTIEIIPDHDQELTINLDRQPPQKAATKNPRPGPVSPARAKHPTEPHGQVDARPSVPAETTERVRKVPEVVPDMPVKF